MAHGRGDDDIGVARLRTPLLDGGLLSIYQLDILCIQLNIAFVKALVAASKIMKLRIVCAEMIKK